MAVASVDDVEIALGRPISSSAEQDQADWWLTGVELFIAARLGPVADLDETIVRYVEVEAVVAKLNRAGRAESSVTVSVDDGSVTRRYENAVTAGDISDDLWGLLDPRPGNGISSVRPGFEADSAMWPVNTPPAWTDPTWLTP